MPFCPKCGTKIEENTTICPNCGEQLEKQTTSINQPTSFSNKYLSKYFVYSLILSAILIFSALITGGIIGEQVTIQEATQILNEITEQADQATAIYIFFNNVEITLLSFIPVIGVIWMLYEQFITGYAIGALAKVFRVDFIFLIGATLVSSTGLLEFSAYILTVAESILIIYSIFNKDTRKRISKHSWKTVLIVVGLLFIGGIAESVAIGRPLI